MSARWTNVARAHFYAMLLTLQRDSLTLYFRKYIEILTQKIKLS